MKKTFIIFSFFAFALLVGSCGQKQPIPTDAQMIEHFELNKTLFEELCSMIENDALDHFPLFAQEKRDSVLLSISADRELEYDLLMKKIQIQSFWDCNPYQEAEADKNSILFFYFVKGDATWGIEKGFEYVFDRSIEDDKEFTEKELYDLVIEKHENCQLYKKINDNWNLFIFYDR